MTCPRTESIARLIAEDLPVAEARALERHLEGCPACSGHRAAALSLVGSIGSRPGVEDGEAFVRETLARLDRPPTRSARWRILAAAAVVLVALPLGYLGLRLGSAPDRPGTFTARGQRPVTGSARLRRQVGVEPLLVRGLDRRLLEDGVRLRPADALAFRYSNLSGRTLRLMAFAVDASGEVHWFYPAYLDAGTDPAAVPIEARARGKLLAEVVQPQGVVAGRLRVVTLVMELSRAMTVKQVERLLSGRDASASLSPLFPAAIVADEWTVRMEGNADGR
jgi:anti-sigma factor RsiW